MFRRPRLLRRVKLRIDDLNEVGPGAKVWRAVTLLMKQIGSEKGEDFQAFSNRAF